MKTYTYRATMEPGEDPDVVVVTFPDVPEAITEGRGAADARIQAADALGLALLAYVRGGRPLPAASEGQGERITVEPDVAAKLAVVETFALAGISKSELGRRIGKDEKEVRRILDPMHATKLRALAEALAAMGKQLVVGIAEAA